MADMLHQDIMTGLKGYYHLESINSRFIRVIGESYLVSAIIRWADNGCRR